VAPWIVRIVAAMIFLAAGALAWWHLRVRRAHHQADHPPAQYDYVRRQFRRRIQISMMIGTLAVLLAVETWVRPPMVQILVGVGMLVLTLWIMLLALLDAVAARMHFGRLRNDYVVERAKLEAEARRLRGAGGNGKPRGEPIGRGGDNSH